MVKQNKILTEYIQVMLEELIKKEPDNYNKQDQDYDDVLRNIIRSA